MDTNHDDVRKCSPHQLSFNNTKQEIASYYAPKEGRTITIKKEDTTMIPTCPSQSLLKVDVQNNDYKENSVANNCPNVGEHTKTTTTVPLESKLHSTTFGTAPSKADSDSYLMIKSDHAQAILRQGTSFGVQFPIQTKLNRLKMLPGKAMHETANIDSDLKQDHMLPITNCICKKYLAILSQKQKLLLDTDRVSLNDVSKEDLQSIGMLKVESQFNERGSDLLSKDERVDGCGNEKLKCVKGNVNNEITVNISGTKGDGSIADIVEYRKSFDEYLSIDKSHLKAIVDHGQAFGVQLPIQTKLRKKSDTLSVKKRTFEDVPKKTNSHRMFINHGSQPKNIDANFLKAEAVLQQHVKTPVTRKKLWVNKTTQENPNRPRILRKRPRTKDIENAIWSNFAKKQDTDCLQKQDENTARRSDGIINSAHEKPNRHREEMVGPRNKNIKNAVSSNLLMTQNFEEKRFNSKTHGSPTSHAPPPIVSSSSVILPNQVTKPCIPPQLYNTRKIGQNQIRVMSHSGTKPCTLSQSLEKKVQHQSYHVNPVYPVYPVYPVSQCAKFSGKNIVDDVSNLLYFAGSANNEVPAQNTEV